MTIDAAAGEKLLTPYTNLYSSLNDHILALPTERLLELKHICAILRADNCHWMAYHMALTMKPIIDYALLHGQKRARRRGRPKTAKVGNLEAVA